MPNACLRCIVGYSLQVSFPANVAVLADVAQVTPKIIYLRCQEVYEQDQSIQKLFNLVLKKTSLVPTHHSVYYHSKNAVDHDTP